MIVIFLLNLLQSAYSGAWNSTIMKTSPLFLLTVTLFLGAGSLQAATFTVGDLSPASAGNNWPAAENPGEAVDGDNASKYLNFGKLNTGYIVTLTSGTATATGINFTTANDAAERDPASYILYGSNTAIANAAAGTVYTIEGNFTQVATGALALPDGRGDTSTSVAFTNPTAYSTYLLVFPTVKNAATANSMQIAEARIQTAAGNLPAGTVAGGLFNPIPEPSVAGLLALGLGGLMVRKRRH